MLINNILFIHIPKTAGTSIEHWLGYHNNISDTDMEKYLFGEVDNPLYLGYDRQHNPLHYFIQNKIPYNFAFSFVRNPYNRLISAYKFFKTHIEKNIFGQNSHFNFQEWFNIYSPTDEITNYNNHFIPQTQYLKELSQLNYLGKYETLYQDIVNIEKILNIKHIDLPIKFKSDIIYIDTNSINNVISKINDYYYEDFIKFNYEIKKQL